MNRHIVILLLICQLLGCSKPETKGGGQQQNKIQQLLHYAESDTIVIAKRLEYNRQAYELIQQLQNDSTKTIYLFKVANRYYNNLDFVNYKIVCGKILGNGLLCEDSSSLAKAYEYYGDYYNKTTTEDSAFYFYEKSEKLYFILKRPEKLAWISLNKATVLFAAEDYYGAETAALRALSYYKHTQEHRKIFEGYTLLGAIAMDLEDYTSSLRYFKIALNIAQQHLQNDGEHPESLIYNNIAAMHINIGQPEEAINSLNKALNDSDLFSDNPSLYAIVTDNLAYAKSAISGNSKEVLKLYKRSLEIKRQLVDTSSYSFTKIRMAEYLLSIGDSANARTLSREVFEIATKVNDTTDSNLALKVLMIADPKNSSNYANIYLKNSDALKASDMKVKNKFARFKFDTDQIINERENAIKQKWIVLAVAMSTIIIISLVLIIQVQRNRQKELKLIQIQQNANAEIYNLMLEQQNKIEDSREFEKKRIARDLHDGVMNKLTSTRLNLFILNKKTDSATIDSCLPYIAGIQDIEKEIRVIAHDLNNSVFNEQDSFKIIINQLFHDHQKTSAAICSFEIDKYVNWDFFPSANKVHIYRILQELLQNINKHANAQNLKVIIKDHLRFVLIQISDDGMGFSPNVKRDGIGLSNLRIRVKALKAKIEVCSSKSNGTVTNLKIPYVRDINH